eukprot:1656396-Amphidinium_carterae.1
MPYYLGTVLDADGSVKVLCDDTEMTVPMDLQDGERWVGAASTLEQVVLLRNDGVAFLLSRIGPAQPFKFFSSSGRVDPAAQALHHPESGKFWVRVFAASFESGGRRLFLIDSKGEEFVLNNRHVAPCSGRLPNNG